MSLLLRSSRLAVLALAAATGAHAAEFGDASVRSYSGQPLAADIELTELTTQELADLQVRLARPDVFQGANVKMDPALAGANISIVRRDSRRVLRVTTNAPVRAEVLHLYFQLVSGGRERVRSVSLWLSPDPNPAPAPTAVAAAPASVAAPAAAAARADKPASRHAARPAGLVATASPGKEATPAERELMGAVERALAARGGKVEPREEKPARPAPSRRDTPKEASKYASTADDFRRVAKPRPAAAEQARPAAEQHAAKAEEPENKAPQRSFLPSKAELADAARATKASVEAGAAPVAKAAPAAAGQADPAMLNKLAELEGKLKTLQAQLAMTNTAGAARVAAPAAAAAKPAAAAPTPAPASAPAKTPEAAGVAAATAHGTPAAPLPQTPDTATVAAAAAAPSAPAAPHAADSAQPEVAQRPETAEAAAAPAAAEEPKAKPEQKKEAAPPPPEPKKEIKISRPKLLTYLFIGSLVLLGIFGVIVHYIRKAKMKRSPIVRQSWSREDDDMPARVEPVVAPELESKAA